MTVYSYRSNSLHDTERLGRHIAKELKAKPFPYLFLLQGTFGAGKTTFIKSVIAELAGIASSSIASPTFQYVALYGSKEFPSIAHFDLWRLSDPNLFVSLGLDDLLDSSLSFIEWPEKAESVCPESSCSIRIQALTEDERIFEIEDRAKLFCNFQEAI